MTKIYTILKFLNILDKQGNLSITNILVLSLGIKLLIASQTELSDTLILLIPIISYMQKRYETNKAIKQVTDITELSKLTDQVSLITKELNEIQQLNEDIKKQSDDVRKLINNNNLSHAFKTRG